MIIEISFNRYQHNWYVGELYHKFYEYLIDKHGNDSIKFTSMDELAESRFAKTQPAEPPPTMM